MPESGPTKKRILIVEDDRISRESLAYLLRGMGHEVREVWSAEDAKSSLAAFVPEIALLDVRLPGLPGDAFAHYLRHKVPTARIVFISGEFRMEDVELMGGNVQFLSKPINFEKLVELING